MMERLLEFKSPESIEALKIVADQRRSQLARSIDGNAWDFAQMTNLSKALTPFNLEAIKIASRYEVPLAGFMIDYLFQIQSEEGIKALDVLAAQRRSQLGKNLAAADKWDLTQITHLARKDLPSSAAETLKIASTNGVPLSGYMIDNLLKIGSPEGNKALAIVARQRRAHLGISIHHNDRYDFPQITHLAKTLSPFAVPALEMAAAHSVTLSGEVIDHLTNIQNEHGLRALKILLAPRQDSVGQTRPSQMTPEHFRSLQNFDNSVAVETFEKHLSESIDQSAAQLQKISMIKNAADQEAFHAGRSLPSQTPPPPPAAITAPRKTATVRAPSKATGWRAFCEFLFR